MSHQPRHVPAAPAAADAPATLSSGMTHREVLETLSGLLLGMFVAILSSTVVSNALPTIVAELDGSQSAYTWVITSSLLATTISTPIWGKLSDLFSKKLLVQLALVIFIVASMAAGLSQNMATLITTRVFQGLGAGGLTALSQVILATIVSPRERGRYSGYLGATFALGTVAGPLIGGAITEHISWRWCFYVGVPFALAAIVVLQKTLRLPTVKRAVHIDYLGAILLAGGVSSLLIWVSLAGDSFDWWSWQTGAMVGGGIVLLALTIMAERVAPEPIIPLRLFRKPTTALASLASLFVGVAMFASTVFLGQYFQLARGDSPTRAGIMTMPMILGLFVSSTVSGQIISKTGRWKSWLISGGILLTAGIGMLGTIGYATNYWVVALWMLLVGTGMGMMMQNLVLAVQNELSLADMGAGSSFVAFTRSLGGAIGVSALGAVLSERVKTHLTDGFTAAHINPGKAMGNGIPHLADLPGPVRGIVEDSYGQGIAEVFLAAAPFALLALLVSLFLKETALRSSMSLDSPEADAATPDEPVEQVWNAPEDHQPEPRLTRAEWEALGATAPVDEPATVATTASLPVVSEPAPAAQPAATGSTAASAPVPALADPEQPGVHGAVTDGTGGRVAGARVTLADQTGRQIDHIVADADGRYRVTVATGGTYLLIAAADGVAPYATLVAVNDSPVRLDVTLARSAGVSGRVLRRDAGTHELHPVGGALVTLTDVLGEVVGARPAAADGSYSFDGLTPGSYVLTAQGEGHRPCARSVDVDGTTDGVHDLVLPASSRLQGVVLAATDGAPVAQATVTVTDAAGQVVAHAVTGTDGRYDFTDVAAGRYLLTASGYAPVSREVAVAEGAVDDQVVELGRRDVDSDRVAR